MVKMSKVAAMVATAGLGLALAPMALADAVPSPALSANPNVVPQQTTATPSPSVPVNPNVVPAQTSATTEASAAPAAVTAEVQGTIDALVDGLGLDVDAILAGTNLAAGESAPEGADAQKVAAAFKGLIIVPADTIDEAVRPYVLDKKTVDDVKAVEDFMKDKKDSAAEMAAAMVEDTLQERADLTQQQAEQFKKDLEDAFAKADADGKNVLIDGPLVGIVGSDVQPGKDGVIKVEGLEMPGTDAQTAPYFAMQYTDADGKAQLDVVALEAKTAGDKTTYSFELPGGATFFTMTPMGTPVAE